MYKDRYKIKIIACYMGKLPEYFDLWLLSCSKNEDIDFLIITDQNKPKFSAKNIEFVNENLEMIKRRFEKKLGFKIKLSSSYKLCDFRPLYGLAFEEYLKGYDFWGHCDIDLIWGDLKQFITNDILQVNEKIFKWGHLSLFLNNEKVNRLFELKGATFSFREVFKNQEYYAFDEITGIRKIIKKNRIKVYERDFCANISRKYSRMKLVNNEIKNFDYQVFYWENGKIIRAYIENENIKIDEFSYLHFQWKKPTNNINIKNFDELSSFYILPDKFIEKEIGIPSKEIIIKYSYYNKSKFEKIERINYYCKLIKQFLNMGMKQKIIWMKQKEII